MKICLKLVEMLVHDIMNEHNDVKLRKKSTNNVDKYCIKSYLRVINDRRHSLHFFVRLIRYFIGSNVLWQFALAVLSVGVNSHAIRFQRLHYRFHENGITATLVVGNIYVRFSH